MAYAGSSNDGYIQTFKVDAAGNISSRKRLEHDTSHGTDNALTHLTGTTYVLAYRGQSNRGKMSTFTIPADGGSITKVKTVDTVSYTHLPLPTKA